MMTMYLAMRVGCTCSDVVNCILSSLPSVELKMGQTINSIGMNHIRRLSSDILDNIAIVVHGLNEIKNVTVEKNTIIYSSL